MVLRGAIPVGHGAADADVGPPLTLRRPPGVVPLVALRAERSGVAKVVIDNGAALATKLQS